MQFSKLAQNVRILHAKSKKLLSTFKLTCKKSKSGTQLLKLIAPKPEVEGNLQKWHEYLDF